MNCLNVETWGEKIAWNICRQTCKHHHSIVLEIKGFLLSFPGMLSSSIFWSLCLLDKTRQEWHHISHNDLLFTFLFRYYRVFSTTNYLHAWCMCLVFLFFLPVLLRPADRQQEAPPPFPPPRDESCSRFIPAQRHVYLATVACKKCRNGVLRVSGGWGGVCVWGWGSGQDRPVKFTTNPVWIQTFSFCSRR